MLENLRKIVCEANKALPENGLVTWTSGNVSGRDIETGYVVVKPSGVPFSELTPEKLVVVDLNGKVIEGDLKPSVDTATHLYVLRNMPKVNAVIHTHSNYATSFAAVGRAIPCVLTAMCDEFGQDVPCAPYCKIGGEEIGEAIVKYIGSSQAILIQNHGVFTVGETVKDSLKAAVMCEDVAKTVHLAETLGKVIPIPEEEIKRAHKQYVDKYGQ